MSSINDAWYSFATRIVTTSDSEVNEITIATKTRSE
jgi:hypothetical protein